MGRGQPARDAATRTRRAWRVCGRRLRLERADVVGDRVGIERVETGIADPRLAGLVEQLDVDREVAAAGVLSALRLDAEQSPDRRQRATRSRQVVDVAAEPQRARNARTCAGVSCSGSTLMAIVGTRRASSPSVPRSVSAITGQLLVQVE